MTSWILGRKFESLGQRSFQQVPMLENEVKRDGGKMNRDAKEDGLTSLNWGLVERDDVTRQNRIFVQIKRFNENKKKNMYKREHVRPPSAGLISTQEIKEIGKKSGESISP